MCLAGPCLSACVCVGQKTLSACEWVVWWLHEYSDPVMNGRGEGEVGRTERWEGRLLSPVNACPGELIYVRGVGWN
jgi:hypothetical protein